MPTNLSRKTKAVREVRASAAQITPAKVRDGEAIPLVFE